MVTRHEFLQQIHSILKPDTYLEVGVQHGWSLQLAIHSKVAIGIDPQPLITASGNQSIFAMTAADYFTYQAAPELQVDFGFIDGSHLYEDALYDFMNLEQHSHPDTVIAFDDVLPYSQHIAERLQPPGDWTGDVWKVYEILREWRPDLKLHLVDTQPTGTLLVQGLDAGNSTLPASYDQILERFNDSDTVPLYILERSTAIDPAAALALLT